MSCVKTIQKLLLLLTLGFMLSACDLKDDLLPSDTDKSSPLGMVDDFTLKDIYGNDFILSDHLDGGSDPADVVVLYFTMWCPVCTSHTDYIYTNIIPQFSSRGTVVYALVDYVSGSVSATYNIAQANGYLTPKFTILADVNQAVYNQFNGAMGITVVIDSDGTILMNEDFRTGETLVEILDQQLPL